MVCCCAVSTIGQLLRIGLMFVLILQMALGVILAMIGYLVFAETIPQRPDLEQDANKLRTSLSLFTYAGEVQRYAKTQLAQSCIMLMVSGIILTALGILGLSSVISSRPKFLLIFLAACIISSTGSSLVTSSLTNYQYVARQALYEVLEWSLINEYDGEYNTTSSWSKMWDLSHVTFQCCGINNYTDFRRSVNFVRTRRNVTDATLLGYTAVPASCCKVRDGYGLDFYASLKQGEPIEKGEFKILDVSCPRNATEDNSHHSMGCREKLENLVSKGVGVLSSLGSTTFGLQVAVQLGLIVIIYASL